MCRLDQFFTKPHITLSCWESLCPVLYKLTGEKINDPYFIEPSAGDGAFYDLLPEKKIEPAWMFILAEKSLWSRIFLPGLTAPAFTNGRTQS